MTAPAPPDAAQAPGPVPSGSVLEYHRTLGVILRLVLVAAFTLWVLVAATHNNPLEFMALGGLTAMALGMVVAYQFGHYRGLPWLLVLSLVACSAIGPIAYGSVHSISMLGFVAAISAGGIFLNRRSMALLVLVISALLGVLVYAQSQQWLVKPTQSVGADTWLLYSIIFGGFASQVYYSRRMVLRAIGAQADQLQRTRQAEQEARLSQERLALIFRHSPAAIAVVEGPHWIHVDVNEAFERIWGVTRAQMLGRTSGEMGFWADDTQRTQFMALRARDGQVQNFEAKGRRHDGQLFDMAISSAAASDSESDSQSQIAIVQVTDVSAVAEARDAMRRSEERFSKAFNLSPVPLVLTRLADGTYLEANTANERTLGMPAHELLGRSSLELGIWPTPAVRQAFITRLKAEGRLHGHDTRMRHRNGTEVDCRLWAEIITVDGEDCALISTLNVTEQKRRETLLEDMARGFSGETGQALLNSLAEHLARAVAADRVMIAECEHLGNPLLAQVRTLALVQDGRLQPNQTYALAGTPCEQVLQATGLRTYREQVATLFPHDTRLSREGYQACTGAALRDADGTPVGLLSAMWRTPQGDATDEDALIRVFASRTTAELVRLRRDREILSLSETLEWRVQARTAQLEASNAELESFAYSVSHDLRSPLRAIDGFTRVLGEQLEGRLTQAEQALFDRVVRSAGRMNELITDLIGLAQVNQGQLALRLVDLSAMAADILATLRQSHPERVVSTRIEPGVYAQCDSKLARIVLENLLGNAWKYSQRCDEAHIAFGIKVDRAAPADAPPMLYVRDNGVGFDMAYADKLFKPFHRLHHDRDFEGSGIGLATVHRILERHGGMVRGRSQPGQGAEFRFCFAPPGSSIAPTRISAF